ncbi:cysteine--tRNA ligase, partial [Candidatus Micrarchaeota archaeon]|nr:cysteine--tRNA ligase [Candidatus Micrarchaeota archaeon]
MKLFNTYTRRKEEFSPLSGEVGIYACGPTVYNYAHIGNLRSYVFEDVLRRYLKYKGFKIKHVMNLTDVDDKTIKGSKQANIPLREFTEKYAELFFEDCGKLNIQKPEIVCKATEHIRQMLENIEMLVQKGFAYKTEDGVYYKLSAFKQYGKLSRADLKSLKPGARVAADEYEKEGVSDFALWKKWNKEDGDVYWETSLGKGRPGWHIECSAMSRAYLGDYFDIHCGGVDLIFPHHENEIAQSQPLTGKPLARFWIHNEHLLVNGKKMAKRFYNFYTLRDIAAKGFSPLALRYLFVSSHYRQQLNLTFEALENAENTLKKLQLFLESARKQARTGKPSKKVEEIIKSRLDDFGIFMDDDLDTSMALAALHGFVNDMNKQTLTPADSALIVDVLRKFDSVFAFFDWSEKKTDQKLKREISALLKERE